MNNPSKFLEALFKNVGLYPGDNLKVWNVIHSFFLGLSLDFKMFCLVVCTLAEQEGSAL